MNSSRIALLFILFVPLASSAQEVDPDRLVGQLGHDDYAVRDAAQRQLEALGLRARDALLRARQHAESEVRARAEAMLARIDTELELKRQEVDQRPRKFARVTIEAHDAPLSDILSALSKQTGLQFDTKNLDLSRKAGASVKDVPLSRALHQLGLQVGTCFHREGKCTLVSYALSKNVLYSDGEHFAFEYRPWPAEGKPDGYILKTVAQNDFDGVLLWDIQSIRTDRELSVETCAVHSPDLVYVPVDSMRGARVTIRGARHWLCDTPVEFADPADGQTWRGGGYTLEIRWPSILVRSDKQIPNLVIADVLRHSDVRVVLKKSLRLPLDPFIRGERWGGRFEVRGPKKLAWCGCIDQPEAGKRKVSITHEHEVGGRSPFELKDIVRVNLAFRRPIEEPVEVTSQPLP